MSRFGFGGGGGGNMFPPVIKFLLITNVIIYILQSLFEGYTIDGVSLGKYILGYFALHPFSSFSENSLFQLWPWQFISYQFLHGTNMHLFFNMFALWMFGNELEVLWGSKRFLAFYLLCGVGAALLQASIADNITIGASGSVYGIMFAYAYTFPDRQIMMFPLFIPIPARIYVGGLMIIGLISGVSGSNSGIAHFAHIAGAISGFLLLKYGDRTKILSSVEKLFKFKSGLSPYGVWQGYSNPKPKPSVNFMRRETVVEKPKTHVPTAKPKIFNISGEEVTQSKIDEILDKISASGYQNLSDKEKNILNELSKRI